MKDSREITLSRDRFRYTLRRRIPSEAVESLQNSRNSAEGFFAEMVEPLGLSVPAAGDIQSRSRGTHPRPHCIRHEARFELRVRRSAGSQKWWRQTEIVEEVVRTYSIPRNGNYFWIFIWLGPDRRFTDWNGSGGPRAGVTALSRIRRRDVSTSKDHIHELATPSACHTSGRAERTMGSAA